MTTLKIAVWRAARSLDGGIETTARLIGRNPQSLRNALSGNPGNKLDLDDAEAIIDIANSDELAIAAAKQRGGVFVRLAHSDGEDVSDIAILELVTRVWRTSGDVGRAVDQVLEDGRIDPKEVEAVRDSVMRAQQGLTDMLRKIEVLAK